MITAAFERPAFVPPSEYDRHLVLRLARSIRSATGQLSQPVFDPWLAARRLQVSVNVTRELHSGLGRLRAGPSGTFIDLKLGEPHRCLRFILCHEIAHLCFLDSLLETAANDPVSTPRSYFAYTDRREESLCNAVAAELLLPRRAFADMVRPLGQKMNSFSHPGLIRYLAAYFGVTEDTVKGRIRELRIGSRLRQRRSKTSIQIPFSAICA